MARSKPIIVAEVAMAHEGSLGLAMAFATQAHNSGADAVKFQMHLADEESNLSEPFRVNVFPQDSTRYNYWKRTEFSLGEWEILKNHCDRLGIEFMCTPFSPKAVELLSRIGVKRWKVGSGDTSNFQLLDALVQTKLPVILSTGMSTWPEILASISFLRNSGLEDLTVLQCTTAYPTAISEVALLTMDEIRINFGVASGLSDHSADITIPIMAIALGASMIECHVAFAREQFGPDSSSSLTFEELKLLTRAARNYPEVMQIADKNSNTVLKSKEREIFGRSICARHFLKAGTTISKEDLAYLKPGGGISWEQKSKVVGKQVTKDLLPGEAINLIDLK
jgi:N-acetylneuraminate synthase